MYIKSTLGSRDQLNKMWSLYMLLHMRYMYTQEVLYIQVVFRAVLTAVFGRLIV